MEFLRTHRFQGLYLSCLIVVCLFLPPPVLSQLSPGDLHQTHSFLEGIGNCTKCHGARQEVLSENCLSCHTSIKNNLLNSTGLHGRNNYQDCSHCHVEHQGRDYELVYWENGREQFDHRLTSYELKGKHVVVPCLKCHRPENVQDKELLLSEKRSLERTFLGLHENCKSCHVDEHRGQLAGTCQKCHNFDGWKPAPGFDHNTAKFVLSGKHLNVLCEKCHKPKTDSVSTVDSSFTQFVGIEFQLCSDCHVDVHKGKLGVNCTGCHNTESWKSTDRANFDHNRTKFPLEGRHGGLACEKCHKPGKAFAGLKFDNCRACHEDFHQEAFAQRDSKGACEECHAVSGFAPARFTIEQHQQTDYSLAGAHLAVPCVGCHVIDSKKISGKKYRFAFKSTSCESCHGDPHKGSLTKISDAKTCEGCHNVETWQQIAFDHDKTKFPLQGKHAGTVCRECHSEDPEHFDPAAMKFRIEHFPCESCHQDIHRGQFAEVAAKPPTDCARCHNSSSWKELKFDHNRDSAYKLEGAHNKVPCNGCHKQESQESAYFVRYKPVSTECNSCHDDELLRERTRP